MPYEYLLKENQTLYKMLATCLQKVDVLGDELLSIK